MATVIKDLSKLKQALKSRLVEQVINLLNEGKYEDAVNKANKFNDKNELPSKYHQLMAESYYQVAKKCQFGGNLGLCFKFLNEAKSYRTNFYLAERRSNLIQEYQNSKKPKTIIHDGEKLLVSPDQIQMAQFKDFRNNMRIPCWTDCKYPLGESYYNCAKCKKLVETSYRRLRSDRNLDDVFSVGIYRWRGDLRASETYSVLLRSFKADQPNLSIYLAQLLADFLFKQTQNLKKIDILTSVPADPDRWGSRGYNPPSLLAKELSKILCIPFIDNILKKKPSLRAKDLSYDLLSKKFSVQSRSENRLQSKNVMLIDDIVTRGFTLSACASILKGDLGAGRISAAVLAKSTPS